MEFTIHKPGQRFVLRNYPLTHGTVIQGRLTDRGPVYSVEMDDRPGRTTRRHGRDIIPMGPLEELATLGKKNPKGPNLQNFQNFPRGWLKAPLFELGDRVRCRHYAPDSFGTVRGFSSRLKGWIAVEFDLRTGEDPELLHHGDLEHVSPLEELAALGKAMKSNPKSSSKNLARIFSVGDRVRRTSGPWSKSKVGTVTSPPEWRTNGTVDYMTVIVLFDGARYSTEIDVQHLQRLTPIEELAMQGVKKNPSFTVRERVVFCNAPDTRGTIIAKYSDTFGKLYTVHWDGSSVDRAYRSGELLPLPPLEALAETAAPETRKNPTFAVGDRVVLRRELKSRGTVIERYLSQYSPRCSVQWDNGLVSEGREDALLPLGPMEALAETGTPATLSRVRNTRRPRRPS